MTVRVVAADHKSQEAKLGDIEVRLRCHNLRFPGFPEGQRPEEFLLTWLKQTLGEESFSHLFAIEQAPAEGSSTRTIFNAITGSLSILQ